MIIELSRYMNPSRTWCHEDTVTNMHLLIIKLYLIENQSRTFVNSILTMKRSQFSTIFEPLNRNYLNALYACIFEKLTPNRMINDKTIQILEMNQLPFNTMGMPPPWIPVEVNCTLQNLLKFWKIENFNL